MKTLWFIFYDNKLLLEQNANGTYTVPVSDEMPPVTTESYRVMNVTPMQDGTGVKTYDLNQPVMDCLQQHGKKYVPVDLRDTYYLLTQELYIKAGKCRELVYWDKTNRYCGVCGSPMQISTQISKKCPKCGHELWPQLAPAVIVRIRRGDEVLLVRGRNFKKTFYGLVAGFVETGETLEEAVKREVKEETNLEITNLHYFGSQPWPYPCGLMIGFTADYASGELKLQREELLEGNWFRHDALPRIPQKLSIARSLIDDWLKGYGEIVCQD